MLFNWDSAPSNPSEAGYLETDIISQEIKSHSMLLWAKMKDTGSGGGIMSLVNTSPPTIENNSFCYATE